MTKDEEQIDFYVSSESEEEKEEIVSPKSLVRLRICGLRGVGKRTLERTLINREVSYGGKISRLVQATRGQGFDLLIAMMSKSDR